MIISYAGSELFENVDRSAPFVFVGSLDAIFFTFVLILQFMGKFKYEITYRDDYKSFKAQKSIQEE
jgi:hypothetical protein